MALHNAAKLMGIACLAATVVRADFTYEQRTQITGGVMVGMMKFAGAFSKNPHKATDPIQSTISVQGNRMLHRTADTASIIDLDKQTITTINYANKSYSVATFDQIKQQMEQMSQAMQKKAAEDQKGEGQKVDMQFDVKMKDTGQTKVINGNNTHETVLTITMTGTDPKTSNKGSMDVTSDMWLAPDIPGYPEVRDFYRRLSEKLDWTPGANPSMMSRPDMARAFAQLYKEGAKLEGVPVYQVTKVGANAQATAAQGNQAAGNETSPPPAAQSEQQAPPPASVGQALGAVLGNRFGGFGRKKKQSADTSATTDSTPGADGSASGNAARSGSLIEMSTELLSYSSAAVQSSVFDIPSGFSQVSDASGAKSPHP